MLYLIVITGLMVVTIVLLFIVLQWRSDRTYRPSANEIRITVQKTINGRISEEEFDEFTSVRIAYDSRLEDIREEFNQIVNDEANIVSIFKDAKFRFNPLNDDGKEKLRTLIRRLELINK